MCLEELKNRINNLLTILNGMVVWFCKKCVYELNGVCRRMHCIKERLNLGEIT